MKSGQKRDYRCEAIGVVTNENWGAGGDCADVDASDGEPGVSNEVVCGGCCAVADRFSTDLTQLDANKGMSMSKEHYRPTHIVAVDERVEGNDVFTGDGVCIKLIFVATEGFARRQCTIVAAPVDNAGAVVLAAIAGRVY